MIQEIIAFSFFIMALIYTLYGIIKLLLPGNNTSSCAGCGGTCGIKPKLRTNYSLDIQSIRKK
jgi:hypothetical protein